LNSFAANRITPHSNEGARDRGEVERWIESLFPPSAPVLSLHLLSHGDLFPEYGNVVILRWPPSINARRELPSSPLI